jgi:hypothetical protein
VAYRTARFDTVQVSETPPSRGASCCCLGYDIHGRVLQDKDGTAILPRVDHPGLTFAPVIVYPGLVDSPCHMSLHSPGEG